MYKERNIMNIQLFGANTLAALPDLDDTQLSNVLIKRLLPTLRAYHDGQKTILKKGYGTTVEWAKFNSLVDDLTAIAEGVPPESEPLVPEIITAQAKQYARSIKLTDILMQRGRLKCKAEAIKLLNEIGRKMIDSLTIESLLKATNKFYGDNKTDSNLTVNSVIKESDIEKAFVFLSSNDAYKFEDGTYHALVTPKMASDIRKMQNFIDKSKYQDPSGKGFKFGEIGQLNGITFLETTNIPTVEIGSSKIKCNQLICYGVDAYGVVDVEGQGSNGKPSIITKGLGSAGTKDPADQEATVAMKFMYTSKILDEKRICNIIAPTSITL